MQYKSDIEIAQETNLLPVREIAAAAGISEEYLELYGNYKAKISNRVLKQESAREGKLVFVTAINPTPAGKGKTTKTVGLADATKCLHKNVPRCADG